MISERRVCEQCTEDDWRSLIDSMVTRLTESEVETGKLHLDSQPPGLIVMLDNVQVGVTPFEQGAAGRQASDQPHARAA